MNLKKVVLNPNKTPWLIATIDINKNQTLISSTFKLEITNGIAMIELNNTIALLVVELKIGELYNFLINFYDYFIGTFITTFLMNSGWSNINWGACKSFGKKIANTPLPVSIYVFSPIPL